MLLTGAAGYLGVHLALALAAALPRCVALTRLSLWGNGVGEAGAAAIGEALPKCRVLKGVEVTKAVGAGE